MPGRRRTWTDEQFILAVEASSSIAEVISKLGLTRTSGAYEAVRRAAIRTGVDLRPLRSRRRWSDDDLRSAVEASSSVAMVMRALGYTESGGIHRYVTGEIKRLGLDTGHFTGQAWNRGRTYAGARARPLSEILVRSSTYPTGRLRQRLVAAGLKPSHCEACGIARWRGERLTLHLDHVNGDHTDNRLENLRVLCPNCHALTDTWCHKNRAPSPAVRSDERPA